MRRHDLVSLFLVLSTLVCFALWGTAGVVPLMLAVIHAGAREFTDDFTS